MITTYRRVLVLPGALAFSMSGLVARLPISMVTLGIVLVVTARTGSYSLAGTVSASYLTANAAFAVLQARVVDRRGQSRVLPWTIAVFSAGLALMAVAVEAGWPTPLPHLFAALAGAALPQVGSCVRARWSHLVPDRLMLQTAFAFEAVVDETVFVVGPMLVTLLAAVVHPVAGLLAAVLAGVVGTVALVLQRSTEPPPGGHHRSHGAGRMGWAVLGPLTVSMFTMGMLFGGIEVATVAFADELGAKAVSGPLLAVLAAGSLLAGAASGAVHVPVAHGTRFRWGLLALGLLVTPLPFVSGFVLLGVVLFLAGFAISPTLIASVAWIEETVPSGRITEGISIASTGLAAGVAPGAAVVGLVVDRVGASASFWVPALAALGGAAVAFAATLLPGVTRAGSSPTGSSG